MKRRLAARPRAWPTVNPYYLLVAILPTLAEGFLTLSSSAASLRQSVQRLAELVEEEPAVKEDSLLANSSSAVLLVGGRTGDDGDVDLKALPDQQLELSKAAYSERKQAENIADELEKQVLELAKTGGPIPKGLMNQISMLVDKVLKPSVKKHHEEDKALLEHLAKDFKSCEDDRGSSSSRAAEADRVRSIKSQRHRQCRKREAQAFEETSECNRQLDLTSKVREHVCNTIKETRVGPADQTSTCVDRFCHYLPGENYELYLRRISAYFQKKLAEFEKAKGACEEMTLQVEREEKACKKKDQWHKQKRQECDTVQEGLERASCAKATQSASSCDVYKACYARNDGAYKKLKPMVERREEDRKAESVALQKIDCLMKSMEGGPALESEVKACVAQTYETTELDLQYQDMPKDLKCKSSSDAFKGRKVPCNKAYIKAEYSRLPKKAPAQQCTPCAGPITPSMKSVPEKCKRVQCEWTLRHSCPGQPLGTRGLATTVDGPIHGYECCCKHKMWKAVKRKVSDVSSVPIVTVARGGGTKPLDPSFWMKECQKIPKDALSIKVVMGSVTDFFKPRDQYTFCDMLTSGDKHLWSSDGMNWKKPDYYSSWGRLGGSAENWPKLKVNDDYRVHLSFWGDLRRKGGCCSSSVTKPYSGWGQAFTMLYVPKEGVPITQTEEAKKLFPVKVSANAQAAGPGGLKVVQPVASPAAAPLAVAGPVQPVAVAQGCGPVMKSDMSSGPYNEAYWRQKCLEIPSAAKSIKVTMGDFTDYFKPVTASVSMCEMLMHRNLHMWSADGKEFKKPAFYPSGTFLGGSAMEWPSTLAGPKRRYATFWGHSYQRGGCCTSSKDQPYVGWNQYFVMEYCV